MQNIYLQKAADEVAESMAETAPAKLKLRKVAISPAREYAMRDGDVRPISNAMAAMILSRCGKVELTPKGITITRAELGGRRRYGHPDHPLCNDFATAEKRFVIYAINIHCPECVHILSLDGRYLGTLPEQGKVAVFDADATAQHIAGQKRQIDRLAKHMQRLHAPDSERAAAAAAHNVVEMGRIVQSLAAADVQASAMDAETPTANRMDRKASAHKAAAQDRAAAAAEARAALILTRKDAVLTCKDGPEFSRESAPSGHTDRRPSFDFASVSSDADEVEIINPFA